MRLKIDFDEPQYYTYNWIDVAVGLHMELNVFFFMPVMNKAHNHSKI